jgi:formylglycine-generating enzyme required for sulfatase activity
MGASVAVIALMVAVGVWLMLRNPVPEPSQPVATLGQDEPTQAPIAATSKGGETSGSELEFAVGTAFVDCPGCPEMVVTPAGDFYQGSPEGESGRETSEGPQHAVRIAYPLAVGKYELSRGEFAQFVRDTKRNMNGCWSYGGKWESRKDRNWLSPGFSQDDKHPATCLSWVDARDYVDWLSTKTGKPYRLMSSSEWEYIARAGTDSARTWGNDPSDACNWANVADRSTEETYPGWAVHTCMDKYVHTAPVDATQPNAFRIYGMLGNVFEWVEDCYRDGYDGAPDDGSAVTTGNCSERVLRGGSWYSRPEYVRSAFLNHFNRNMRSSTFGVRIARDLRSK